MMDRLREGVNSIAVKIILGVIILSFVFAGVGSYIVGGGNNAAAKVGNTEIARGEFEMAYQNERNRMQSQLGDYFSQMLANPEYVESLRKSVLDRMINEVLLDQQAEALGLRISDQQIRDLILELPEFQVDGKFNQDIYQATLRRVGYTPDSFAEYLRRDLVRQQLVNALQTSDFALPGEVQAEGKLYIQTRDIRTITIDLAKYAKDVKLTDEEIQTFYAENPQKFTRPEQVKVSYIELSAAALKKQINVSDEDAKQYYDENLDKYSTEEQRRVAHILIEGEDEAKAQAVLDELNAGADFATLAKEKSNDFGSAENGGDLGFIERDVMDPKFEEAAFALQQVGETSGLVQSDFGFHIIKLEELKDSVTKPYSEVAAEIKQELVDQQAIDQFYELQGKLETVAFEFPDSLEDASKEVGQTVQTTDFISEVNAPELLKSPAVMQAIMSPEVKEDGLNSEAIEVSPEHIVVVRVEDVRPETVLPLEEVKAQVVADLSHDKAEKEAAALATKVVDGLKQGDEAVLAANKLAFGDIESVDRRAPLAQAVFAMPKPVDGKPVYGQTKDMTGNVVIIQLDEVKAKLDTALEEQVAMQMQRTSSQQDLSSIINALRGNTEIVYYAVSN